MAKPVAILATTHRPFFLKTGRMAPEEAPPFAAEWMRTVEACRDTLTRTRPDVLVMVGSDHSHQLWLDDMPQFLVGKAPFHDANYSNEEREFGLPRMLLKGHEDLSAYIRAGGQDRQLHRRRRDPVALLHRRGAGLAHPPRPRRPVIAAVAVGGAAAIVPLARRRAALRADARAALR